MTTPPAHTVLSRLIDFATYNFPDIPGELSPVIYDPSTHISCGNLSVREVSFFHYMRQIVQKHEKTHEEVSKRAFEHFSGEIDAKGIFEAACGLGQHVMESGALNIMSTAQILTTLRPEVIYAACPNAFDLWGDIVLTTDGQVCAMKKANPKPVTPILRSGHFALCFFNRLMSILEGKIVFDSDPKLPPVPQKAEVVVQIKGEMGRQFAIFGWMTFYHLTSFVLGPDDDAIELRYREMSYEAVYNHEKVISRLRQQGNILAHLLVDTFPLGTIPPIHGGVKFMVCEGYKAVLIPDS